jgi:intracellular multiplication protein IcmC
MMLFKLVQSIQQVIKNLLVILFAGSILYTNTAYALFEVNVQTMLQNLSNSVPELMKLVTATSYVMGMLFIMRGVIGLKHFGESRSAMSQEHSLKGPLILLGVGAALIYLPSSVRAGLTTFWDVPTPYAYRDQIASPYTEVLNASFMIVQLIGTIAFIRGLILLTQGGHGQQNQTSKAITHMIGGILCINIYQFIQVITNTLALGQV